MSVSAHLSGTPSHGATGSVPPQTHGTPSTTGLFVPSPPRPRPTWPLAGPLGRVRRLSPLPRDVAGGLAWLSVLVVVALWVFNGGVQGLGESASSLVTGLGRVTGLVSADLLLIQVLLMARIPWVERAWGQDELARKHRLVGYTSFTLMLAHLVAITVGYAMAEGRNVIGEFVDMVLDYPGMLLALVGTLLLVAVVVTSISAARSRMRYENWHLIHLYAYLGVGLALPHQIWTGADFAGTAPARLYWWSLYAAAAGAVAWWRVGVPLWRSWRHRVRIEAVVPETEGVTSVWLRGRDLDRLGAQAGQYFTWRFLSGPGWTRGHPYSLSAAPTPGRMRITVKDLGDDSRLVNRLRPGTKVLFEGPYGRLHPGVRSRSRVTLIAAGIGITPMRALLEALPGRPGDLTLLYRAPSAEDLTFREELDALAVARGARVYYLPGHRVAGRPSWLPHTAAHLGDAQALLQLVPDIRHHDVFLCGADAWMDAVRAAALEAGVPAERIHSERFTW
ncbi:MAG: ferredoxin reductase family protein [Kineosporiaceae bacterium]